MYVLFSYPLPGAYTSTCNKPSLFAIRLPCSTRRTTHVTVEVRGGGRVDLTNILFTFPDDNL